MQMVAIHMLLIKVVLTGWQQMQLLRMCSLILLVMVQVQPPGTQGGRVLHGHIVHGHGTATRLRHSTLPWRAAGVTGTTVGAGVTVQTRHAG